MTTVLAAKMATVLAVIHPAVISAIIPSNVPAAWVSIVILRLVRLRVGAHITVIGPISITRHARGAVISARIIAVRATPVARIRFI